MYPQVVSRRFTLFRWSKSVFPQVTGIFAAVDSRQFHREPQLSGSFSRDVSLLPSKPAGTVPV